MLCSLRAPHLGLVFFSLNSSLPDVIIHPIGFRLGLITLPAGSSSKQHLRMLLGQASVSAPQVTKGLPYKCGT